MKEIKVNVDNYNENSIKTIEGDNLSEVYKIYICKNKRRVNLTNKIAVMAYVDEYNSKRSNILNLNITNAAEGEIELPITNVISRENGVYACEIAIYGENNFLEQTAPFSLIVENNIFSKISNAAINSSDFHILSEAIKTTNAYGEKLKEGTENIELQYAKKLNKLASDTSQKANKSEIGAPIAVNSIALMTDITKVYVNTTDGNWYSYNGENWTVGGKYNSQGIGDRSINEFKLVQEVQDKLIEVDKLTKNSINIMPYGAVWQYGTVNGDVINTSSKNRRWCEIPIIEGQILNFKFQSTNWKIGFYLVDQNNKATTDWYGYYDTDTTFTIPHISEDRHTTKLRLLIMHNPDILDITETILETLDIRIETPNIPKIDELKNKIDNIDLKNSSYLKIVSYNVGLFYDGLSYLSDEKLEEYKIKFRRLFAQENADIMCCQEFMQFINMEQNVESTQALTDFKYAFNTKDTSYSSVIFGNMDLKNTEKIAFKEGNRDYIKTFINFYNKKICIINAHTSTDVDFNLNRKKQIDELIEEMKKHEYVIVCGDFNAFSKEEFNLFKDAGFNLANGGVLGWYETWHNCGRPNNGWINGAVDNIIVSSNISIQNVEMIEGQPSDHAPLIAELKIN